MQAMTSVGISLPSATSRSRSVANAAERLWFDGECCIVEPVIRHLCLLSLLACARNSAPPQDTPPPLESAERAPTVKADGEACDWNRPDFAKMGKIEESLGALVVDKPGSEPRAARLYRRPTIDEARYTCTRPAVGGGRSAPGLPNRGMSILRSTSTWSGGC